MMITRQQIIVVVVLFEMYVWHSASNRFQSFVIVVSTVDVNVFHSNNFELCIIVATLDLSVHHYVLSFSKFQSNSSRLNQDQVK